MKTTRTTSEPSFRVVGRTKDGEFLKTGPLDSAEAAGDFAVANAASFPEVIEAWVERVEVVTTVSRTRVSPRMIVAGGELHTPSGSQPGSFPVSPALVVPDDLSELDD